MIVLHENGNEKKKKKNVCSKKKERNANVYGGRRKKNSQFSFRDENLYTEEKKSETIRLQMEQ